MALCIFVSFFHVLFTPSALTAFIEQEAENFRDMEIDFSERCSQYCYLAYLAKGCDRPSLESELVKVAAQNLMGYGAEKDYNFYNTVRCVEEVSIDNLPDNEQWLRELGSIAVSLAELCREASDFPRYFAELLGAQRKEVLSRYYLAACKEEDLYLAEKLFPILLESYANDSDEYLAIARTAIDYNSFEKIQSLKSEHAACSKSVEEIQELVGTILPDERESYSNSPSLEKEKYGVGALSYDDLRKRVASAEYPAQRDEIILEWYLGQSRAQSANVKLITGQTLELVQEYDYDTSGELLMAMFANVMQHHRQYGFEVLVAAHRVRHGWAERMYHLEDVEETWQALQKHFPSRHLEFFKRTILIPGEGRWTPMFPGLRAIKFLKMFNEDEIAKELVVVDLESLKKRMANFPINIPKYFDDSFNCCKLYVIRYRGAVIYIGEAITPIYQRMVTGTRAGDDNWRWNNLKKVQMNLFVFPSQNDRNWGKALEGQLTGLFFKKCGIWPKYCRSLSPRPDVVNAYIDCCAEIISSELF